jgi:hypothetical protein
MEVEEEVMEEMVGQEGVEVEVVQDTLAHTHPTLLDITEEVIGEVEVKVEGGVVLVEEVVEVVEDMDLQVEDMDLQVEDMDIQVEDMDLQVEDMDLQVVEDLQEVDLQVVEDLQEVDLQVVEDPYLQAPVDLLVVKTVQPQYIGPMIS